MSMSYFKVKLKNLPKIPLLDRNFVFSLISFMSVKITFMLEYLLTRLYLLKPVNKLPDRLIMPCHAVLLLYSLQFRIYPVMPRTTRTPKTSKCEIPNIENNHLTEGSVADEVQVNIFIM